MRIYRRITSRITTECLPLFLQRMELPEEVAVPDRPHGGGPHTSSTPTPEPPSLLLVPASGPEFHSAGNSTEATGWYRRLSARVAAPACCVVSFAVINERRRARKKKKLKKESQESHYSVLPAASVRVRAHARTCVCVCA